MDAARAALARENAALKAELAVALAKGSEDAALIAQQRLRIAKLERQVYGRKSERSARLVDQLAIISKSWKRAPRKTNWRQNGRSRRQRTCADLRAGLPNATHSQIICRANAW
jgi:transposase IS166 family protein